MGSRDPIFVELLHDNGKPYDAYKDFFKLAALSGFDVVKQSDVCLESDSIYISCITGASIAFAKKDDRRAKVIGWQLERCGKGNKDSFCPQYFDEVWLSDRSQASQFHSDNKVRHVVLGGHEALGGIPQDKEYDLIPLAYLWGKRQEKVDLLSKKYKIAPNAWEPARGKILSKTRAGLMFHQFENDPYIEPLRAVLFCMWKLPMIFEFVHDTFPYQGYSYPDEVDAAICDERDTVRRNYDLLTGEMSFKNCVEKAMANFK